MGLAINRVLVANRGEIAVRVIRACKELNIETVALYSDVDAGAPHTLVADDAYLLGEANPAQSYLNIKRIIDIAKIAKADALHPGYGFLSENAELAQACLDAGITFIGPKPQTIRALGDKAEARQLAIDAGVPVVKGGLAPNADDAEHDKKLLALAEDVGFPLMLKAVSGGGGKGMRVVRQLDEVLSACGAARREAKSSFGDDAILVERFIEKPKHIEIQILADKHGNAIHLGERECSIQRRHQKIIEEAPSLVVDETLRQKMGEAALKLVKKAGYENAGTVEFLVDSERNFFFLEVNTRLQVEHPVTESVTNVDLVHEQLFIAGGERLRLKQEDIKLQGHAIEVRLYAENPEADFVPSPGKIVHLFEPQLAGLRIDSGVRPGQEIPVNYDPILAKIIAWAPQRKEAIARLRQGLREYSLLGPKTNQVYLYQLLGHSAFNEGELNTHFIAEHFADYKAEAATLSEAAIAATLLSSERGAFRSDESGCRSIDPWDTLDGWRLS